MILDAAATASDPGFGELAGGTLTVDFTANGSTNDRLTISGQTAGTGRITLSGSNVSLTSARRAVTHRNFTAAAPMVRRRWW